MEVPWPPMNFSGRVHDDVHAVAQRLAQVWRRQCVVDDERDLVVVGDLRDAFEVEHVTLGVAESLPEERLRVGPDRRGPGGEVVGVVDERRLDAQLGQRVVQEVVRAAIEGGGRDDVTAVLGEVQERDRLGGLPAGERQRGDTPFERGHPLLEDGLCRVHDARVDVPELLEPEECRRVRCVPEGVARRLVDRHGAGVRRRIGNGTRMDLAGLKAPVGHGGCLLDSAQRPVAGCNPRLPELYKPD